MKRKSIFGILMLVLALSLTLGFVSAEDVATDGASDVLAADDNVVVEEAPVEEAPVDEEGQAAGGDVAGPGVPPGVELADVGVIVTPLFYSENDTVWSVFAYNYGPDTAKNAYVQLDCSDNLVCVDFAGTGGEFDYEKGIWYLGDMPAMSYAELLIEMLPIDKGPYFVDAAIKSDTFDPFLGNNYDIAYMGLESVASAAEETLPATGNPLAMALLALVAVGVGGIRRLF